MKLNYINKIKKNITISSTKKTSNILDGVYKSVYKGKSMNFENLREYVINDDIKDIDWKASARSGNLYVKQFIAEKKHNILLIMDTGKKMDAVTDMHESKKNIALFTAGTLGYIAIKNNDYIGMIYSNQNKIEYKSFKYNLYNLEEYLCDYEKNAIVKNIDINELIEYSLKTVLKKTITFIITDIKGLNDIKSNNIKKMSIRHDVMIIVIKDNYMTGENIYDLEEMQYIPKFLLNDPKIYETEKEAKEKIYKTKKAKLKKYNVNVVTISSIKEINNQIINLLEEHRYASKN